MDSSQQDGEPPRNPATALSTQQIQTSNLVGSSEPAAPKLVIATEKPYTIFVTRHRRLLTAIVGIGSLVSPLTANIYLPLLPLLQVRYSASAQAINLTLTVYVIVAAIMPAFFAPAADTYGRRPVSLLTSLVFALGGVGLALNDAGLGGPRSYAALVVLRGVQALGASACASILYGVISDVCVPAERGTMVGPAISASNLGIVLGPTLGGLIAWRSGGVGWVFWVLAAFGLLNFLLTALFLPETARGVVGRGDEGKRQSRTGVWGWVLLGPQWGAKDSGCGTEATVVYGSSQKAGGLTEPLTVAEGKKGTFPADPNTRSETGGTTRKKKRLPIPNPLSSLTIMLWKDTSVTLWLAGCNYAVWYCISASFPRIYTELYNWNQLAVGLAYLPSSFSIIVAGFVAGPWMNARYRRTALAAGLSPDSHHVDGFPIEKARIGWELWPIFTATHGCIAALGWAVATSAHPAALLCIQVAIGFLQSILFLTFNTLLVDVNPDRPSTVSAAASLVRSGLSGIGVAVLQPLVDTMGWGWYFTLLAVLVGLFQGIGMAALLRWGMGWREKRREIERERFRVATND